MTRIDLRFTAGGDHSHNSCTILRTTHGEENAVVARLTRREGGDTGHLTYLNGHAGGTAGFGEGAALLAGLTRCSVFTHGRCWSPDGLEEDATLTSVPLTLPDGRDARITTEHAASSYGMPVLVIDGQAYGPGDILPNPPGDPLDFLHEPARVAVLVAKARLHNEDGSSPLGCTATQCGGHAECSRGEAECDCGELHWAHSTRCNHLSRFADQL